MEEFLKIKECKYLSILTTFSMGKGFSSIQEYNDYYGYEQYDAHDFVVALCARFDKKLRNKTIKIIICVNIK